MTACRIRITGQVQGVGFRPFVWRQAARFGIVGSVQNDAAGVVIHAQGGDLDAFVTSLQAEAPALSRIAEIAVTPANTMDGLSGFEIETSSGGDLRVPVTPDVVLCADCRAEVSDPRERRYRYPFTNCTQCGPRFSIVEALPYDRANTVMQAFEMCPDCRRDYEDPADRRFHAQPIACPVCGPVLWFEDKSGARIEADALEVAIAALRRGEILAIKGLGGFHLACDAGREESVARLRQRKWRPAKPFALMATDLAMIRRFASLSEEEAALLQEPAGPIVLLNAAGERLARSVAPGQWALGWMLPTTPLHLLLMQGFGGPLVMTSGNLSGEPQVIGNQEAREKLAPFVDGFLMHDREIARRLDDSVTRVAGGVGRIQRRARGYAPQLLPLPSRFRDAPSVLAYGAFLKAAICLTRDGSALLSHHLGDLDEDLTARDYARAITDYADLMDHVPEVLACDRHPDYPSTSAAEARAEAMGIPLIRVQHHHAHIAAVLAETLWEPEQGPVLGVAMDGLGWGDDGTVWGGEWLLCDYAGFERLTHLTPVRLPGGGAAQREPWRNLLAQLDGAGRADAADEILAGKPLAPLRAAMAKGVNAPLTSSAGRLFDAMAALLGLAPTAQSFEGEAAMALETLARRAGDHGAYRFGQDGRCVDPAPVWEAALRDRGAKVPVEVMAARFQEGLAVAIAETATRLAAEAGAKAIALSGGCFQNMTLLDSCLRKLDGQRVLLHAQTPPNDGGIALGQAVIAAGKAVSG